MAVETAKAQTGVHVVLIVRDRASQLFVGQPAVTVDTDGARRHRLRREPTRNREHADQKRDPDQTRARPEPRRDRRDAHGRWPGLGVAPRQVSGIPWQTAHSWGALCSASVT